MRGRRASNGGFATAAVVGLLVLAAVGSIAAIAIVLAVDGIASPTAITTATATTTATTTTTSTTTSTTTMQLQCNSTEDPAIAPCVNRTCNAPGAFACAISGPACVCDPI